MERVAAVSELIQILSKETQTILHKLLTRVHWKPYIYVIRRYVAKLPFACLGHQHFVLLI